MDEGARRPAIQRGADGLLPGVGCLPERRGEGPVEISVSTTEDQVVLLQVEGAVDAHTARELDRALQGVLAAGDSRLVLGATQMSYISSAGLRVVLQMHREAVRRGGEVRIFGLNALATRVFETAGFQEVMRISGTYEEAVEGW
jgi:anti-anti-sigma factor